MCKIPAKLSHDSLLFAGNRLGTLLTPFVAEKLRSYFGAYGAVTDAVVMKDPISRRSRGFGFITYADPACVDRALAQPNHILDSRRVRPAQRCR